MRRVGALALVHRTSLIAVGDVTSFPERPLPVVPYPSSTGMPSSGEPRREATFNEAKQDRPVRVRDSVAALSVMLTDGEKSDLVEYLKSLPSEEEASS